MFPVYLAWLAVLMSAGLPSSPRYELRSCHLVCCPRFPSPSRPPTHHPPLPHSSDVWRHLHPEEAATYTVWNEKTSARAFNQAGGRGVALAARA